MRRHIMLSIHIKEYIKKWRQLLIKNDFLGCLVVLLYSCSNEEAVKKEIFKSSDTFEMKVVIDSIFSEEEAFNFSAGIKYLDDNEDSTYVLCHSGLIEFQILDEDKNILYRESKDDVLLEIEIFSDQYNEKQYNKKNPDDKTLSKGKYYLRVKSSFKYLINRSPFKYSEEEMTLIVEEPFKVTK